jgi:spermidine synthase
VTRARPLRGQGVTLSEEDGVRFLHFGTEWVQGAMRIARPWRLELEYQQQMMAVALLQPQPREILQLGLGAAGLARFCHRHLRTARVTAVEIDPEVIAVAHRWFRLPTPDARLRVLERDARVHLDDAPASADWLQVDLYDAQARGPVYDDVDFYRSCRRALRPGGVAAFNLFGRGLSASLAAIGGAFGGSWARLLPTPEGNCIVLALQDESARIPVPGTARRRAAAIGRDLRLPAGQWLENLRDSTGNAPYAVGG